MGTARFAKTVGITFFFPGNKKPFPAREGLFATTEFRRIYGVVCRTLLHGEATDYLLVGGAAGLYVSDTCSGLGVNQGCKHETSCHQQRNDNNCAENWDEKVSRLLLGSFGTFYKLSVKRNRQINGNFGE